MNDLKERRKKFDDFLQSQKIALGDRIWNYSCPSCGYPTLGERDGYEICILCGWEDDGQDDKNADEIWGGPNSILSLTVSV
ncbi:MAG: CPCC family cysteine-rich protein [Candidatus Altiarchaeota archaeon]